MKKLVAMVMCLCMGAVLLAGCGAKEEPAAAPSAAPAESPAKEEAKTPESGQETAGEEEVNIQFLANETPILTRDFWQVVVDRYTAEHPNVHIELIFQPSSNITVREHAKTLLSTGQFPDVMVMATPSDFVPSGALLPFEDSDVDMIKPEYVSRIDGKIYVVPYKIQVGGVFYNKDLFKENNLEVPETWEELVKICDTFNSKGITPAVMGLKDGWAHTLPFQCIETVDLLSKVPDWPQQRMKKEANFADTPEFVEGVEKFVDLMTKYNTSDRSSMTYAQSNEYFFSGKSAMYMMGSWTQGDEMNMPHDFEVGFFPIPGDDAADKVMPLWVNEGLSVSSQTKYPEVAKDFVKFFIQDPTWSAQFLQTEQLFTPLKEEVKYEKTPLHEEIEGMMDEYKGIPNFFDTVGDNAWIAGGSDLLIKFTLKLASDPNADMQKELENLDREFDKLLDNAQ